jgi:outer membrane protein OmpA-like peptidoglycan-associated protein
MKRSILFLPFFFISPLYLSAQTAGEVESVLSSREINFAQASRFVLTVAEVLDETAEAGRAYALAREQGWVPQNVSSDRSIRLGELCFLIMRAFKMKGSFLYGMFPGPHYAFRELNYLKLIPGQRDPGLKVSGERFLQILGMVAAYTGIDRETPVPRETAVAKAPEKAPVPQETAVAEAPEVKKVGAVRLKNIQFMPDSAELTETEKDKLREISAVLSRYPGGKVLVGGYTAMARSEDVRRRVSIRRARAAADFLTSLQALPAENIIVRAYGARRSLTGNAAKKDWAIDRRVEITLVNEDYYTIQFMPDSAELPETEKDKLRELAAVLSRYPDVELLAAGYAEEVEGNRMRISTERARAAADFLRLSGFRFGKITVRGYGAEKPPEDNAPVEGNALNRRVEIIIQNGSAK